LESFDFKFPPLVNPGRISKRIRSKGAFKDNTIIAEGSFIGADRPFGDNEVKMKAECRFNIVFDQGTPVVAEWAVIGTLLNIADRTREILERISLEFFGIESKFARPLESTRPK
jgi:hypothetical protein